VLLKSDLDVQQTSYLRPILHGAKKAPALGVTKFTNVRDMILVTLYCATKVRLRCSTKPPLGAYSQNLKICSYESYQNNKIQIL
jgi:hypothetical protein